MKWEVLVQKHQFASVFIEAPTGREAMSLAYDKAREMLKDDTLWGEPHCRSYSADIAIEDKPKA
jgi:hypothetical protein